MPLHELGSVPAALTWLARRGARALATDSRRIAGAPGSAFIAWPGYAHDARQFVDAALRDGAVACLLEADGVQPFRFTRSDRLAVMRGLKAQAGPLASGFFGMPSERLTVLAVTGTNGKTSTAWWTAQALGALGRRCGVVGTLGVGEPPSGRPAAGGPEGGDARAQPAGNPPSAPDQPTGGPPAAAAALRSQAMPLVATGLTTPDAVTLHAAFRRFVDAGFAACAIEASSIGLEEHRLSGTHIDVALLTNVTQDHLDYHGSMAGYWQAKAQLFSWPGLRAAVLNADDAHGAALAAQMRRGAVDVWTYSMRPAPPAGAAAAARLQASGIAYRDGGLCFEVRERDAGGGEAAAAVGSRLVGDYNVANLLAVIGGLRAIGVPLADAAAVCAGLTPVPGRLQRVPAVAAPSAPGASTASAPEVVVDYAHTPDALEKALLAMAPLAAARGGVLWCVFGCGGDRDAAKRPLMGALAQRLARHAVVTSDNPRGEAPAAILAGIVAGMAPDPAPLVIEDRRAAIRHAVARAQPRDVVLVAGKGHEDHQEVAGVKHPFDDAVEAREALALRGAAAAAVASRAEAPREAAAAAGLGAGDPPPSAVAPAAARPVAAP